MRTLKRTAITFITVVTVFTIICFIALQKSLPLTKGRISISGLSNEVRVDRDSKGIPTIIGHSRTDVAQTLGFLHAQDRFFQMDLMRRAAAGELSELFGKEALEFDKQRRLHQLRVNAKNIYIHLSPQEKEILHAYTLGVNQGLQHLGARPFEYFLLRVKPQEWKKEDTVLVGLSLFFELQDSTGTYDLARGYLRKQLPDSTYDFFMDNGSAWDSALDGSRKPIVEIPGPDEFHFHQENHLVNHPSIPLKLGGSNQWAVIGARTKNGAGMVACDMHLNFSVPTIWYRAAFKFIDTEGEPIHIIGATLPGTPFMAVGSNQHIAWGFTNGYIDTTDLVMVSPNPNNEKEYLTINGPVPFESHSEQINIKGEPPETFIINKTIWGPILSETFYGHTIAVQWIAHLPSCFNLRTVELETTKSAYEALAILDNIKIPIMNFVVADKEGHIGWKWVGALPHRMGFDGSVPVQGASVDALWKGLLNPSLYPEIIDPSEGHLWTANNRTLENPPFVVGQYLNGIRAHQIKKRLQDLENTIPTDMLEIQLDDEAIFFKRWQKLLVQILEKASPNPRRKELLEIMKNWHGHCSTDSSAYYWIRTWRKSTYDTVFKRLLPENCYFALHMFDFEEPLWKLVSEKPEYLINPLYPSWDDELLSIADSMMHEESPLNKTWGSANTLEINHPMSHALPILDTWLNMPHVPVGGDFYVPYLNNPIAGASQRMVVSPGNEEEGIFHMPCGQCGHPLSPHYRDSHSDWLNGTPSPFLPDEAVTSLVLLPT
jgi:penicillin amidase